VFAPGEESVCVESIRLPRRSAAAALGLAGALCASLIALSSASAAVNYDDFSSTAGLKLNGSAGSADNALRLTPATSEVSGSAFTKRRVVKANRNFTTKFAVGSHDTTTDPGDGMAFVIQSVGRGEVGGIGGGLGYAGIGDSLIVEFDTFDNGEPGGSNHVAITKNGDPGNHLDVADPGLGLYGNTAYARVTYKARRHRMKVWVGIGPELEGAPLLKAKVNLAKILDGDGFAGFTAATGSNNAIHDALEWHLKSG
jgi:hypothetical protein